MRVSSLRGNREENLEDAHEAYKILMTTSFINERFTPGRYPLFEEFPNLYRRPIRKRVEDWFETPERCFISCYSDDDLSAWLK